MQRWIFLICLFCVNSSIWAHDPTEITYDFNNDQLIVHITPKGAMDLISSIHPELFERKSINLLSYATDYTKYFNEHIALNSNGQNIELEYEMAELSKHNSWIKFKLSQPIRDFDELDIEISAFVNVYKDVENTIIADRYNMGKAAIETNYSTVVIFLVLGLVMWLGPIYRSR